MNANIYTEPASEGGAFNDGVQWYIVRDRQGNLDWVMRARRNTMKKIPQEPIILDWRVQARDHFNYDEAIAIMEAISMALCDARDAYGDDT